MSEIPAIRFQNVSKKFTFATTSSQTLLESLISTVTRRQRPSNNKPLWAVQDVDFDVMPGDSLGIIGQNGSGKSTLLKLATRILRPTNGQVVVNGRVSALLELGAGFHPDLTGRENIYLNGSVLGLKQEDIDRVFDHIVEFSELDEFIDMPVKHYSSGMYMRLGFSVAIHVTPDILLVDEILAVGDQAFQAKCIDQIFHMKRQGITIVMVSHNLRTVGNLCSKLVWLDHGQVRAYGSVEDVLEQYIEYSRERELKQLRHQARGNGTFRRIGTGEIEITAVRFLDHEQQPQIAFKTGSEMTIEMSYQAHGAVHNPDFGIAIFRQGGAQVNGPTNQLAGLHLGTVEGQGIVRYHIRHLPLLPATYRVTASIHDDQGLQAYDYHEQAYPFRIIGGGTHEINGMVELPASWEWEPEQIPTP